MADESANAQTPGHDVTRQVAPSVQTLPEPAGGKQAKPRTSRRSFLKVAGGGVAGAVVGGAAVGTYLTQVGGRPATAPAVTPVHFPLRFFTDAQALVITAMAERIFPHDETGPGATDAHVLNYIDGRLVSAWGLG